MRGVRFDLSGSFRLASRFSWDTQSPLGLSLVGESALVVSEKCLSATGRNPAADSCKYCRAFYQLQLVKLEQVSPGYH